MKYKSFNNVEISSLVYPYLEVPALEGTLLLSYPGAYFGFSGIYSFGGSGVYDFGFYLIFWILLMVIRGLIS